MGQPTQRATNYTARSNIVTAKIFLHANGQRPKHASNRQRSRRRQARGATHRARPRSPHSGIDGKRPTEKFVTWYRARTWYSSPGRSFAALDVPLLVTRQQESPSPACRQLSRVRNACAGGSSEHGTKLKHGTKLGRTRCYM